MASTVNKVILIGNLGDDIKMHYFEGGNSIGRFPIATSESYTSKQTGEKVTTTDWHNIVVRNKLAEICEKYLTKGDKVYVELRGYIGAVNRVNRIGKSLVSHRHNYAAKDETVEILVFRR